MKISKAEFVERSIKKHGNYYDYSLVEWINTKTKICTKCRNEKSISEFPKDKSWCKFCVNEYKRGWNLKKKKEKERLEEQKPPKTTKICGKCDIEKPFDEFPKDRNQCLKCRNLYYKDWREKNPKKSKAIKDKWRKNNKEYCEQYRKENFERIQKQQKAWKDKNKKHILKQNREYVKKKCATDPLFKCTFNIRHLIYQTFRNGEYSKKSKTYKILGCSFKEFKEHIENQFEPWMNWNVHGLYNGEENFGWDFDHIIPVSSAKTEEEIIKLNHYTNFQPLCSYTNRVIKKDIINF
jgi:hypothetical protein